jgi:outer membrane protein TolC
LGDDAPYTHTAHHRGQQLALLRMLGREEYSNYGPTTDTGGLMQNHAPTIYPYPSLEALLEGEAPGVGGAGQSLSTLFGGNFPTAQVGVQISLPLRNRTAEAQLASSEAEGRRLKTLRDQVAMAVEADVRNALQAAASAESRLAAASLARKSAEEQYSSEQRQFQAGTSTVFLALQRQTDLIAAKSREVRAESDVAEAKANLYRARENTIQAQGLTVTF